MLQPTSDLLGQWEARAVINPDVRELRRYNNGGRDPVPEVPLPLPPVWQDCGHPATDVACQQSMCRRARRVECFAIGLAISAPLVTVAYVIWEAL